MSYQDDLRSFRWIEGREISLLQSSYRHRIVIVCSKEGRQKTCFGNGEFPYFAYTELLNGKGEWISHGNNIVPVLSDSRFLMVIEQRPALERYPDHRCIAVIGGKLVDLGPCGSLEFPGGGVESGEEFTASFLRELCEETGIAEQTGYLCRRLPLIYPFGSDIALAMFYNVIYLSGFSFPDYVDNDGGLRVVALTRDEVEENIHSGAISSGQAALQGWAFFKEIDHARSNTTVLDQYIRSGYVSCQSVIVKKPK